jgi:hypothetical protein
MVNMGCAPELGKAQCPEKKIEAGLRVAANSHCCGAVPITSFLESFGQQVQGFLQIVQGLQGAITPVAGCRKGYPFRVGDTLDECRSPGT